MSNNQLNQNQLNQILNQLNNSNCYISADANEKGHATLKNESMSSIISNLVIIAITFIFFILLNSGFKQFYDFLFHTSAASASPTTASASPTRINSLNVSWFVLSLIIILFSLICGIYISSYHIYLMVVYIISYIISINVLVKENKLPNFMDIDFSKPDKFIGFGGSILVSIILWITSLMIPKKSKIVRYILSSIPYFILILGGIISTFLYK